MRRCEWCARFVKTDTPITCWRVSVGNYRENRQISRSKWNYWCRVLCPDCAECTYGGGSWEATTLTTATKRRPAIAAERGWPTP